MTGPGDHTADDTACAVGGHLSFLIIDPDSGLAAGTWCAWCGEGHYNRERITVTGAPIGGWEPRVLCTPAATFTRTRKDVGL